MDLQQQQAALKNTIRLLEAASRAVDNSEPALVAAVAQVRDLIRGLPDGLFREKAWKELQPTVVSILARASGVIGDQLSLTMAALTPEQAQFASNYLVSPEGYGFSADAPGAAAARRASTGENSAYAARTVEAFPKSTFTLADIAAAGSSPELLGRLQQRVPDDVAALIKKTPIRGATLQRWFGSSATATGVGRQPEYAKWAAASIDRNVRAGFLSGVSSEEVARNLIFDEVRGQMRLGQGAVRLKSDARAIAKTGLMDLADQAHLAQLRAMEEESGRTIAKRFRWDASTDSRLCPDCALLDGQEWEKREDVPPRPHIGCVLGDTPVGLGSVVSATRFRYWGDLVSITTASGRNVTVTAQHPMLTDRGWVSAVELSKGDNLIRETSNIPAVGGAGVDGPDLDHEPPTAEQVFEALLAVSPVGAVSVPVASVQFHGDGAAGDGYVEVVAAGRQLQDDFQAALGESFGQIPLIGRFELSGSRCPEAGLSSLDLCGLGLNAAAVGLVGIARQSLSLLRGQGSHADSVRLAAAAWLETDIAEPPVNSEPGDAEVLSQCLGALTSVEQRDQLLSRQLVGSGCGAGIFQAADLNALSLDPVGDGGAFAPVILGDGEGGLTGLVALDDVVDVRVEPAPAGGVLVYDFTTASSTYSVARLVSHNCRCQILPVTATELLLREEGASIRSREELVSVEFTDQPPPPQRPGETRAQYGARMRDEGIFLTKGRAPSGEMQWRRRVVRRAGQDAPDWLASMARATSDKKSAALSLQEFFGGNRGGAQRAAYFVSQIRKGVDPRDALNNMLRQVGGNPKQTQFIPVAKLRKLNPSIEDATPILSARQRRAVSAGRRPGPPRRGY